VGSFQKDKHSSQSGMIPGSWQYKMKLQLILKSSKAYYVLSDAAMILQKYGRALRYIKLALQCHGKLLEGICDLCHCLYIPFTISHASVVHDLPLWHAVASVTTGCLVELGVLAHYFGGKSGVRITLVSVW